MDRIAKNIPRTMSFAPQMVATAGAGMTGVSSIGGGRGATTVNLIYSPGFSAASYKEFETKLVPMIDKQLNHNERRRVGRGIR
jgi:hypothetical protein